jgi:transglutaminase-like putative cysteine protease
VIYDIRHVTTYEYESAVSFARCTLRLEPKNGDGQQLISHQVEIRPRPAERHVRRDFFGTLTESIVIEVAHRNLRIDSRSRVLVSRKPPARDAASPAWESIRDIAFEATSLGPSSPVGYVFASPLVPVLRPVSAYAASSFAPGAGILAGAVDLMHRIHTEFRYDPKATVISTPLNEVFDKRHGVCQDFAHVMIAGLRGLGLPAAYVAVVRGGAGMGRFRSHQRCHGRQRPYRAGGRTRLFRRLAGRRHHRRLAETEARRRRGCAVGGVIADSQSGHRPT